MAIFKKEQKSTTKRRLSLPKLVMLKTKNLTVDASYQRKIDLKHVKAIEEEFDPDLFGVIVVSERNGIYYVVDGQHRVLAVKDHIEELPCLLWQGLSYEEECEKFKKLNILRKSLNANIIFHNMVCAKNKDAMNVVGILKSNGFDYNRDNQTTKDNVIGSPKRMLQIYETYGADSLNRMLTIMRKSWHGTKQSLTATILVGLHTFLTENPQVKDEYVIKALEKTEPTIIKAQASYHITADNISGISGGRSRFVHIANAIKTLYNKNVPKSERVM